MNQYREMPYREYLKTEHWQSVRNQRVMKDGFRCALCGSTRSLNVHHLTYENIGTEDVDTDVVTLCSHCHTTLHRIKDSLETYITQMKYDNNGEPVGMNNINERVKKLIITELWLRDFGQGGDIKVFDTGMDMVSRLLGVLELMYRGVRFKVYPSDIRESLTVLRHGKICEMYMRGGTLKSIADELQMKPTNVQKVLKYHGMNYGARIK